MDKIWLQSYPKDVPAEIDTTQFRSLAHLLEDAFRNFAPRDAFACMGKHLTYADLDRLSRWLAAWLQSRGLKKGDRVAIMMPNLLQYPVALAGILRAGCAVVNVNPLYTPRELEHQLRDSGAAAIIILENFAAKLEQVIDKTAIQHVVVTSMGDMLGSLKGAFATLVVRHVKKLVPSFSLPEATSFRQVLTEGERLPFHPADLGHEDVAFLQYTGGTTGVSKGATLVQRNVIANTLQNEEWAKPALNQGSGTEHPIIVCALPLYHIFALTACCLLGMRLGGMNILIPNPRDVGGVIKAIKKYHFNMFPAVNTLYNALLNHPDFSTLDFSDLKVCNGGGMAIQRAVNDKWEKATGRTILEGYGLSETAPVVTCNPGNLTAFSGSIGVPLPSTEVAILDDAGNALAPGQQGEIAIRGPQVMAGYWNRPDETAKVMTPDGFFKSGDIGVMDEHGFIRLVDRKKDMILVSGFNVYPNEIEDVVAAHLGVLECACVGVPDETSGEAVKLFVVRRDPGLTAEQLVAHCKEQLTGYKRPKFIEFRNELPKSTVGKILRRELRDQKTTA